MGIFITDNDATECAFFSGNLNGETICVETEAEAREKFSNNMFEKHVITFKKMNYGTMKKIQNACMQDVDGKFTFNPLKFRSERFANSIKQWTFKDSSGNLVPISSQAIDNMSNNVANFLLDLYDKKIG